MKVLIIIGILLGISGCLTLKELVIKDKAPEKIEIPVPPAPPPPPNYED